MFSLLPPEDLKTDCEFSADASELEKLAHRLIEAFGTHHVGEVIAEARATIRDQTDSSQMPPEHTLSLLRLVNKIESFGDLLPRMSLYVLVKELAREAMSCGCDIERARMKSAITKQTKLALAANLKNEFSFTRSQFEAAILAFFTGPVWEKQKADGARVRPRPMDFRVCPAFRDALLGLRSGGPEDSEAFNKHINSPIAERTMRRALDALEAKGKTPYDSLREKPPRSRKTTVKIETKKRARPNG